MASSKVEPHTNDPHCPPRCELARLAANGRNSDKTKEESEQDADRLPFILLQEIQQTSRPLSQSHRPSMSSTSVPGGLSLSRQSHSRNHSHSVIGSALNGAHRITRRKSMTNTGAN